MVYSGDLIHESRNFHNSIYDRGAISIRFYTHLNDSITINIIIVYSIIFFVVVSIKKK